MSNLKKSREELDQTHAIFNLAPLTEDLAFSYIIKIDQANTNFHSATSAGSPK